jgi:hypothetical protein
MPATRSRGSGCVRCETHACAPTGRLALYAATLALAWHVPAHSVAWLTGLIG